MKYLFLLIIVALYGCVIQSPVGYYEGSGAYGYSYTQLHLKNDSSFDVHEINDFGGDNYSKGRWQVTNNKLVLNSYSEYIPMLIKETHQSDLKEGIIIVEPIELLGNSYVTFDNNNDVFYYFNKDKLLIPDSVSGFDYFIIHTSKFSFRYNKMHINNNCFFVELKSVPSNTFWKINEVYKIRRRKLLLYKSHFVLRKIKTSTANPTIKL